MAREHISEGSGAVMARGLGKSGCGFLKCSGGSSLNPEWRQYMTMKYETICDIGGKDSFYCFPISLPFLEAGKGAARG